MTAILVAPTLSSGQFALLVAAGQFVVVFVKGGVITCARFSAP